MNVKSFSEKSSNVETPNDIIDSEKPLISEKNKTKRVDINVLKSKLEEQESKEFKKNLSILATLIIVLGFLGIYFSL